MNRESFLLLLVLLFALPLHLQASSPCNNMADTTCISDSSKMFPPAIGVYHVKPMKNTLRHSLPLVAASLLTFNVDEYPRASLYRCRELSYQDRQRQSARSSYGTAFDEGIRL